MARIMDGREVAAAVDAETASTVARLKADGVVPGLAVVLVGDDAASATYVGMKERACERFGIRSFDHRLPTGTPQAELNDLIESLNADSAIHGILPQLPLPGHLDAEQVVDRISPEKDVDGFGPTNLGRLVRGLDALRACTPAGVMRMLKHYRVELQGKRAVVVGRSTMVGKPMALMLLEANATVTVAHSRTVGLAEVCREADVLVAAVGRPKMLDASYVQPGAVVVDVGTNRTDEGLVGDVDFAAVEPVASLISPVPGGVGPMTIAMLMSNTAQAAARAEGRDSILR